MSSATKQKMELIKRKIFPIIRNSIKYLYFLLINAFCEIQYVILDCEFCDNSIEIIQMGLFKLNSKMEMVDSLNIYIKPINQNIIKSKRELRKKILQQSNESKITFPMAIELINEWLGNDHIIVLCTWGDNDLLAISKNIVIHDLLQNKLDYRFSLDVQQIFVKKRINKFDYRPALKRVLKKKKVKISEPLHNALTDVRYTARLLEKVYNKQPSLIAQYLIQVPENLKM